VGFVDQNLERDDDDSVLLILNSYKEFLNNYKIFDFIVTRDTIAHKTLRTVGINNIRLLDSVFYSPYYYSIKNKNKSLNVITVRDLNSLNDKIIKSFSKIKVDETKHTIYLAHDITDFNTYYKKVPNLICINNPKSLLEIYSYASNVVSLRVHGSVPALYFGANVSNISIDSRSDILNYVGLNSIDIYSFIKKPTVSFNSVNVHSILRRDMDIFLNEFYNKCQVVRGKKVLIVTKEYIGKDYWTGKTISNYSNPVIRSDIQYILSDAISRVDFNSGLDLGCAAGYFVYLMNSKGKNFKGIDLSDYVISVGKKEFPSISNYLYNGSIHDLSVFPDSYFDLVYSQQVLEHLPTELVPIMVNELYRVCKPNTKLFLFLVIGYKDQIGKSDNDVDETHQNLKTKEWWDCQFRSRGFIPIDTSYIGDVSMNSSKLKNLHKIFYVKP